jgi:hypothetical protein
MLGNKRFVPNLAQPKTGLFYAIADRLLFAGHILSALSL